MPDDGVPRRDGLDREGLDRDGLNREGLDREDFDRKGLDRKGFGREGMGWGFGVLAGVIALILLSWATGGNGNGWGSRNQLAHMMPPGSSYSNDGPATRAFRQPSNGH